MAEITALVAVRSPSSTLYWGPRRPIFIFMQPSSSCFVKMWLSNEFEFETPVLTHPAHGVGQCDFLVTVRPCDTFQIRTCKQFFGNFNFWFTYYLCHQKTSPLLHTYIYAGHSPLAYIFIALKTRFVVFPKGYIFPLNCQCWMRVTMQI